MAKRRRDSGEEGILLVDKPEGPTSFDVVGRVRKALGTRSVGHTGTLDPLAEGLLVLLVGRYTRLSAHLTRVDKRYLGKIDFGARTTTDDREGEVIERGDPSSIDEDKLRAALAEMTGPIRQIPPAFSAVSIGGERLYLKARRGEKVEAPPRDVTISEMVLLDWSPPSALLDISCSKGTYIRAIARDVGDKLGVPAHLGGLRRTESGGYEVGEAVGLDALDDPELARSRLLRGPSAIQGLPTIQLDAARAERVAQGRRVPAPGFQPKGKVALAFLDDDPVAIVEQEGDELRSIRGFGPRVPQEPPPPRETA